MAGLNKCIEMTGPMESFQVVNKPIPQPPPHGMVIKNHYSGICHTDVHSWEDKWKFTDDVVLSIKDFIPDFEYPIVIGHELSGEVHSLGSEYKGDLRVGERVAVYPWCGCEDCTPCKAGDQRACARFSEHNTGVGKDGGYQQYTVMEHGRYVFRAADGVPMDALCLMSCSGLTALNSVFKLEASVERTTQNSGGASVLIIGAGGLGMWAIKWAKAIFPDTTKVLVADISEEKLAGAVQQGADDTILFDRAVSDDILIGQIKEKSGGGVAGAIDFVGIPATSYKAAMSLVMGGTCVVAGLAGGTVQLPLMQIALTDINITGVLAGPTELMPQQMKLFVDKKIQPPPITRVKPEDAERCLRELATGKFQGRYVIDWTSQ